MHPIFMMLYRFINRDGLEYAGYMVYVLLWLGSVDTFIHARLVYLQLYRFRPVSGWMNVLRGQGSGLLIKITQIYSQMIEVNQYLCVLIVLIKGLGC